MMKIMPSAGVAPAARRQLPEYADPVSGPYAGWDPVQFQKVGGFAGGIRSASGAFRRPSAADMGMVLANDASRRHFWGLLPFMREATCGDAGVSLSVLEHFCARFVDRHHDDREVLYRFHRWCEFLNELRVDYDRLDDMMEIEAAATRITGGDFRPLSKYSMEALTGNRDAALKLWSLRFVCRNRFDNFEDECAPGAQERFEHWGKMIYDTTLKDVAEAAYEERPKKKGYQKCDPDDEMCGIGDGYECEVGLNDYVIRLFEAFYNIALRDERAVFMLNTLACEFESVDAKLQMGDLAKAGRFRSIGHMPMGASDAYPRRRRPGTRTIHMPTYLHAIVSGGNEPLREFDLAGSAYNAVSFLAKQDEAPGADETVRDVRALGRLVTSLQWVRRLISEVRASPHLEAHGQFSIDDYIRAMCECGHPDLNRAIDFLNREMFRGMQYVHYFLKFARFNEYARSLAARFSTHDYINVLGYDRSDPDLEPLGIVEEPTVEMPDPLVDVYDLAKQGVAPAAQALKDVDVAPYVHDSNALRMLVEFDNDDAARVLSGAVLQFSGKKNPDRGNE